MPDTVAKYLKAMQDAHLRYVRARRSYDPAKKVTETRMQNAHRAYVNAHYRYIRELIRTGH